MLDATTEPREIVTVDRPIGIPAGERIMREVADKYGVTAAALRVQWRNRRKYVPARIEAARRMTYELGYTRFTVAKIMRRDHTTITFYLGRVRRRQPVHTPEKIGTP